MKIEHRASMGFGTSPGRLIFKHPDDDWTADSADAPGLGQPDATSKLPVKPLVSVIIPTYNRAWSLVKTVHSVYDQSYRPLECVIVDDGSTDNTSSIVNSLAGDCPTGVTLQFFKQANAGPNSARNRGLLACTGEFICYLDSDDMLTSDSIERRASVLIQDPEIDFSYGLCSVQNEHGTEIGTMNERWPSSDEPRISRYLFHTDSPLIRRSTCSKVGLWRTDDPGGQEHEYFARLKYFSTKVHFIDKPLSIYVKHNRGSVFDRSLAYWLAIFRMVLAVKALVLYGESDNQQERLWLSKEFRSLGKQLYQLKDYRNARAALQESLILAASLKVLAEWGFISLLSLFKKM